LPQFSWAHRGGKVDAKFRQEIRTHAPDLYAIGVGEMLPLDGDLVKKYTEPAVSFSQSLFKIVDEWLKNYPD
jgi:hypothetical protein